MKFTSADLCGLWHAVQLTPFARCADLEKFCVSRLDWWHLVQMVAVWAGVSVSKRMILVTSPPPSTCACAGPWQPWQPWFSPFSSAACGVLAKCFSHTSWWHVLQISVSAYWPALEPGSAADDCGVAGPGRSCSFAAAPPAAKHATRTASVTDKVVQRLK